MISNINLIRKVDTLKPGQWWLWECEYDVDGKTKTGYIEGNEHIFAKETLEDEEGNRIK